MGHPCSLLRLVVRGLCGKYAMDKKFFRLDNKDHRGVWKKGRNILLYIPLSRRETSLIEQGTAGNPLRHSVPLLHLRCASDFLSMNPD